MNHHPTTSERRASYRARACGETPTSQSTLATLEDADLTAERPPHTGARALTHPKTRGAKDMERKIEAAPPCAALFCAKKHAAKLLNKKHIWCWVLYCTRIHSLTLISAETTSLRPAAAAAWRAEPPGPTKLASAPASRRMRVISKAVAAAPS